MLSSAKQIFKRLQPYLQQGYILCPDTNFLMNASDVFPKLKHETVMISKQVYNELDNLKNSTFDAGKEQKRRSFEAREGLRALDLVQATIMEPPPASIFGTYHLSQSPDDRIIANYLHYRDSKNGKILFLTLDRGAKLVAKSAGLETVEFDIDRFHKKRKRELKVINKYAHKRKLNPIHRFIIGMASIYFGLTVIIQSLIGIGFILWVVSLFLFPKQGYVATAKPVKVMNGEVMITPTLIYQEDLEDSKKFYVHYEVKNNQEKTIRGFFNPDRPLEQPKKQQKSGNFFQQNNEKVAYDLKLNTEQMYVIFDGLEDENIYAGGVNEEVDMNERSKGVIEIEGDLSKLKELRTSVFIEETNERIPYTIKIDKVKKVESQDIKKLAKKY